MKTALQKDLVLRILFLLLAGMPPVFHSNSTLAAEAGAPASPYEIRLKSRQFTPDPAAPQFAPAARTGRRWHGMIQFEQPLDPSQLQALQAKGIKVRHYVSGHTVSATVPADVDPKSIPGVRWSGGLTAEDKLLGSVGRDVLVEFFPDTLEPEMARLIVETGGERRPTPSLPKFIARVVLPDGDAAAKTLAGSELVSSVAATPDAVLQGEDVHYCPGAMTIAGPVANYVLQGQGWDGPGRGSISLSYYFGAATSDLTVAAQRAEIVRALQTWSRYAAISWSQTSSPNRNRSLDIHFRTGAHGDGDPFDGPGSVLAHCYYPNPPNSEPIAGDMHLDDDETWRIGARHDLFSVALHEAGHGLGLNHSDNSSAVMAPYYAGVVRDLTSDDIAGIRALYASAGPSAPTVPNDNFANAASISGMAGTVTGGNVNATRETGEPAHAGITASKSIWYRWTAPASGSYTFRTLGSTFDTLLAVYTGSSVSALFGIAANDDTSESVSSEVRFTASAGTVYRIAVDGYNDDSGNVTLRWEGQAGPGIINQPVGRSLMAGQPAAFSVTVSGGGALSYQWLKNGGEVGGANQASYTIASTRLADAGSYRVRVSNASGSVLSDTAMLEVTSPDAVPPRVSISAPRQRSRQFTPLVQVTGLASDNQRVAQVQVRINGGAWLNAYGTETWSANVIATPGLNTVQVRALDAFGNTSPIIEREFIYVRTSPLAVRVSGDGRVTPNLDGRALEVGRSYILKARPARGSIFSHWSGAGASSEATLRFVMIENLSLSAYFIRNPFPEVAGSYNGLFYDTSDVDQESSGYFTVKVTSKGKFSASIRWLGKRIPVSGQFRPDGRATNVVTRVNFPAMRLELALDFTSQHRITGTVYLGGRQVPVQADRSGRTAGRFAGRYQVILPNAGLEPDQPAVLGQLTIGIDRDGNATVAGRMADGAALNHRTTVSEEGYLPLHAVLDHGRGSLIGWIRLMPEDAVAMQGLVSWLKAPAANAAGPGALSENQHLQANAIGERTEEPAAPSETPE